MPPRFPRAHAMLPGSPKRTKHDPRRQPPPDPVMNPLNNQQQAFVDEFQLDLNANAAAARVGYTAPGAGLALVANPKIAAAIALARAQRSSRTEIYADEVLRRWWQLATADVNEVVQLRRVRCGACYCGDDHSVWDEPDPECSRCGGHGEPRVYHADSRALSPSARALYAGVEQTAYGPRIKLRDQEVALLNVAKHLGMLVERREIAGVDGEPLEIVVRVVKPAIDFDGEFAEVVGNAD